MTPVKKKVLNESKVMTYSTMSPSEKDTYHKQNRENMKIKYKEMDPTEKKIFFWKTSLDLSSNESKWKRRVSLKFLIFLGFVSRKIMTSFCVWWLKLSNIIEKIGRWWDISEKKSPLTVWHLNNSKEDYQLMWRCEL